MDVFKLRDSIIEDYSRYISSFIEIFDSRITETVNKEMNEGLLWPYPLIQLNPPFAVSEDLNSLVDQNVKICGKGNDVMKIQTILNQINLRSMALPEFQRGYGLQPGGS